MKKNWKSFLAAAGMAASVSSSAALANSFPSHAITMVVPWPPGGPSDMGAKARPDGHTNGTTQHLAGELFQINGKLDMIHVPYRGTAPAIADLLRGRVTTMGANWVTLAARLHPPHVCVL